MSGNQRILLVDDEPEIVEYLKIVLESYGFDCVGVNSGQEGINLANTEPFAAIISDMKMPKMTGIEMLTRIRTTALNANTPMVVLSGALTDDMMISLERLGIIDVMSKPPDMDILVRVIQKASKHRTTNTGKKVNQAIVDVFQNAFTTTIKGLLGDKVPISVAEVNERALTNIEFCGMVTMFGRRVSGVLSVAYESGFAAEFAKTMMGRPADISEVQIFETTPGEIANQTVQAAAPILKDSMGIHLELTAPIVVHGRFAAIPVAGTQPRVKSTVTLNGQRCHMEFALLDLSETFKGVTDNATVKIIEG